MKSVTLLLIVSLTFSSGCATILTGAGQTQDVRFTSTPKRATVHVDGNHIGSTPISATLTRKDRHRVRISHAGYQPYRAEITSGFNFWVLGNAIIGGLIGVGVDLLSGAGDALSTTHVHAALSPEQHGLDDEGRPSRARKAGEESMLQ